MSKKIEAHLTGVLTDGQDDHVGLELAQGRQHDFSHGMLVALVAGPKRQRDVQVEALANALASFVGQARLRVRRAPGAVVHVHRDSEHVFSLVESLRRAIAIVHINVQHRHPFTSLLNNTPSTSALGAQ